MSETYIDEFDDETVEYIDEKIEKIDDALNALRRSKELAQSFKGGHISAEEMEEGLDEAEDKYDVTLLK